MLPEHIPIQERRSNALLSSKNCTAFPLKRTEYGLDACCLSSAGAFSPAIRSPPCNDYRPSTIYIKLSTTVKEII